MTPKKGSEVGFQVDKAFKAPLRFLGFFLDRLNLSTNKLLGFVLCKGSTEVWRLRVKSLCLFLSCPRKRAMRFFVRNSKNGTCERDYHWSVGPSATRFLFEIMEEPLFRERL